VEVEYAFGPARRWRAGAMDPGKWGQALLIQLAD